MSIKTYPKMQMSEQKEEKREKRYIQSDQPA
jgi:hypothetical protein